MNSYSQRARVIQRMNMKDIAKMAGVSQSTVSRVFSGNPSVNPDVKMKVIGLAKEYNYKPNVIAQNLVGSKSMLIGLIIPCISNPFFSDVVMSIEREASKYGYSIILCNSEEILDKEKKYIGVLNSYNVDGMMIVPCNGGEEYFQSLKNGKTPIVVLTQNIDGFNSVSTSHINAGREVARHLYNMGYSKFAFVGKAIDEKEVGFREGLEGLGVNIRNDYRVIDYTQADSLDARLREYFNTSKENEGIGIFTINDVTALKVLHVLKEMDIKTPEKAALVGFDNTFISKEVNPPISSVAQPLEEMGKQAVEMLLSKINKNDCEQETHVLLEPRLVVRESSMKITRY